MPWGVNAAEAWEGKGHWPRAIMSFRAELRDLGGPGPIGEVARRVGDPICPATLSDASSDMLHSTRHKSRATGVLIPAPSVLRALLYETHEYMLMTDQITRRRSHAMLASVL